MDPLLPLSVLYGADFPITPILSFFLLPSFTQPRLCRLGQGPCFWQHELTPRNCVPGGDKSLAPEQCPGLSLVPCSEGGGFSAPGAAWAEMPSSHSCSQPGQGPG